MKLTKSRKMTVGIFMAAMIMWPASLTQAGFMDKFKKSKSVDLAPFADQTIGLLGQLDYGLKRNTAIRLRKYADKSQPDFARLVQLENHMMMFLKGILRYSLKIWELSEKNIPETEKCRFYSEYLGDLAREIVSKDKFNVSMSGEDLEEGLAYIAGQKKLLKALEAAGPFMDQFDSITRGVIQEVTEKSIVVGNYLGKVIAADYAQLMMVHEKTQDLKAQILHFMELNLAYFNREPGALEKIRKLPILKRRDFAKYTPVTTKNLPQLRERMLQKLSDIQKLMKGLQPDYEDYFASHKELQQLIDKHDREVKEASVAIIVWSRAHRTMASGKVNPAEWFDLTNTKALIGFAKDVAF